MGFVRMHTHFHSCSLNQVYLFQHELAVPTYLHEIPVLVETGEIFAQDSCDHCGSDAAEGGREGQEGAFYDGDLLQTVQGSCEKGVH